MEAAALELAVAIHRRRRLEDGEGLGVATGPRQVLRAQQVDGVGRGSLLGRVEQPLRTREVALHFPELRPVREDSKRARREAIRLHKGGFRFRRMPLLHQVECEVRKRSHLWAAQLSARRKCHSPAGKSFDSDRSVPNWSCRTALPGWATMARRASERVGVPAVAREQGDKIDEGPVSAAIARNDVRQRFRRSRDVPARDRIAHARGRGSIAWDIFLRAVREAEMTVARHYAAFALACLAAPAVGDASRARRAHLCKVIPRPASVDIERGEFRLADGMRVIAPDPRAAPLFSPRRHARAHARYPARGCRCAARVRWRAPRARRACRPVGRIL
jgi:hypothetical protein